MSFGFDKIKQTTDKPERKLDLSGLQMQPPAIPVEKEKKALAKGEALGFSKREPIEGKGEGRVVRRHWS